MIRESTLNAVYSLSERIGMNGQMVSSVGATPLAVLGQPLYPVSVNHMDSEDILKYSQMDIAGEKQPHSAAMDEMVEIAANAVRMQLSLAQTVVKPAVGEMLEKIEARTSKTADEFGRYTLRQVALPQVYTESTIADLVERYSQTPQNQAQVQVLGKFMPEIDLEALQKAAKSGIKRVDDLMEKTILSNADILNEVYSTMFRNDYSSVLDSDVPQEARDVVAFFMARHFLENVPEGVDLELSSYRAYMAGAVAEFGRRIYQAISRDERIVRQRQLVLIQPSQGGFSREVVVHKGLFDRFIKEGGNVDSILGAAVRGISSPNYADLLEDAYGGVKAMAANERLLTQRIESQKAAMITEALVEEMKLVIKSEDYQEQSNAPAHLDDVYEWLKTNRYQANTDLRFWVMEVVCDVLYPEVNAKYILSQIQAHLEKDEKLTPREAATLVTLDIIADWLVEQMEVDKAR